MSEIELRDAILRHSLQLLRLSAGQQAEVEGILKELEAELKALLRANVLSEAGKREIEALIREADAAIAANYGKIPQLVDTHALAVIVADKTVAAIGEVIPATIAAPTAERLASLTKDVLIEGAPSSAWWAKQGEDTAFKFAGVVRQGVINGWTNEQIVARIAGSRTETGIMDIARRNARSLVHSSVMSAANAARLATFQKNGRYIEGVRWLATLDSHVCPRCAALDGQAWNLEGEPLKGTTVAFLAPPIHFADRCSLTPIPKSLAEFGIELPEGTRASAEGPISATTTFADFLRRQPESFVDKVLGKRRADLFLAGKLNLRDLISGTGRELTLAELEG
jgi:SPP1 gp7 family putative phage head morphogenesis protein